MKGIELCKAFYQQHGKPMLQNEFAEIVKYLAVGVAGSGSDCYGYDDALSQDHDFEPGFCIFLPSRDLVDDRTEFLLEKAYASLPSEFMGYRRQRVNPAGGGRKGVIRVEDFTAQYVGRGDFPPSDERWLRLEEPFLFEITDGEIFEDNLGLITDIRKKLSQYPEDVRLKRLAGNLLLASQSGQYNYSRCVERGDSAAAALCATEFVNSAMQSVFLLNRSYMPYYKWRFRAFADLQILANLYDSFEFLLTTDNTQTATAKIGVIGDICRMLAEQAAKQNLVTEYDGNLDRTAYAVNDKIGDPNIRNLNILYCI